MKKALVAFIVVATVACAEDSRKEEWRESGHSWRDSGRQFLRALGRSISGEGSPKEEWKATGREFKEAGEDTADALGKSVQPRAEPAEKPAPQPPMPAAEPPTGE
jgi:hypothetical protein